MLTVLFLGDVVGEPGRSAVIAQLPRLKEAHALDFIIINGEKEDFTADPNWDAKGNHNLVEDTREESNAVVLCIMDTSGSMDTMKKYLARSFFFLLYQFICTKYRNVEIVFIAHHTEANEVTEEEFFHKGESGGTFISSGYQKALDIIVERYHPSLWNIYAFHFSDGDNWSADDTRTCVTLLKGEILPKVNQFAYGQVESPYGSGQFIKDLREAFDGVENVALSEIANKDAIYNSIKDFLGKGS